MTTWMTRKKIMLSKKSQTQKVTCDMSSLIRPSGKGKNCQDENQTGGGQGLVVGGGVCLQRAMRGLFGVTGVLHFKWWWLHNYTFVKIHQTVHLESEFYYMKIIFNKPDLIKIMKLKKIK